MGSHSFPPNFSEDARILILGSMPGVESLRQQQYYAFRFNVFWRIIGELFGFDPQQPYALRLECLKHHRIALWDVLQYCERAGSLDAAIRNAQANDIPGLLKKCPQMELICCNGGAAYRYFKKFFPAPPIPVLQLPSTSPAAARLNYEAKLALWRSALIRS